MESRIQSLSGKIAEQKSQSKTALSEAKKAADSAVAESEAKAEASAAEIAKLNADLTQAKQSLFEQETANVNLSTKATDLELKGTALSAAKAKADTMISVLKDQITSQESEAEAKAEASAAEVAKLKADLTQAKQSLFEQETANVNLSTKATDLELKGTALSAAKAKADTMISVLKDQITSQKSEAEAKAEASAAEIAKLNADLTQAKQSLSVETERSRLLDRTIYALNEELERPKSETNN